MTTPLAHSAKLPARPGCTRAPQASGHNRIPSSLARAPSGAASQGWSVAISADGNTAIIGGPTDNSGVGTAWMFARNGEAWSQQGSKLVATDATGLASQGFSVAISADGNTAIVGGPYDNSWAGAAWVYTRSGGRVVAAGRQVGGQRRRRPCGSGRFGGHLGGRQHRDRRREERQLAEFRRVPPGAAWASHAAGVGSQEGNKLVGTGAVASAGQGRSVAISGDGNTVIVGADLDDSVAGAVWVYTRSGGVWSQQGGKLVGSGAAGNAGQGTAVAISGGGNIAIVGGPYDNSNAGAAWVFTLNGGVWSQTGSKLVGTDSAGPFVYQGWSVAISGDGTTSIIGGPADNTLAPLVLGPRGSLSPTAAQRPRIPLSPRAGPSRAGRPLCCRSLRPERRRFPGCGTRGRSPTPRRRSALTRVRSRRHPWNRRPATGSESRTRAALPTPPPPRSR